jgi:hypothetical protein
MHMRNELAFTVSREIQPPGLIYLGRFLASPYVRIRVLAYCPSSAQGDVELLITHVEGEGTPGHLDRLILVPGSNVNQVYEVPGVILSVSARATTNAATSLTVSIWGFRTGLTGTPATPAPPPATNPLDEFLPAGALTLSGVSPTGFNPPDAQLTFNLSGARFWQVTPTDTVLTVNDQVVPDTNVTVTAGSITVTAALTSGRNAVHLASVDDVGRPLYFNSTIWAGTNPFRVSLTNQDGTPFLEEANVKISLVDDQAVHAEVTTDTGVADFVNVPASTVLIQATASGNRMGAIGVTGNVGTVTVALLGFDAPSTVDNNDFSQGNAGWNVGSAAVQIVPHQEEAGPTPDALVTARPAPPPANAGERQRRHEEFAHRLAEASRTATVTTAIVDNDLQLVTAGEGEQSISRTFLTDPDVSAVRLRYRFVTSEVPGGYFGSQFNDYFRVSMRSQTGGGSAVEANSMNGLGVGAFDGFGSTAWRDCVFH